jgi:hypothetical protein
MVVVATAFVTEARSKRVAGVTSRSKPPPSREVREKGGAPFGYLKWPKELSAIRRSPCVTAMEAAGNAWVEIASFRIEKAEEKSSS